MIAVYDDEKDRWQPFEAIFTDKDEQGFPLLDLSGYGPTEEEAVADLIAKRAVLLAVSTEVVERKKGRP